MPNLRLIVEGQTEERVVKDVLAPHLAQYGVWATATLVNKTASSQSRITKGGGRKYHPYRRDIVLTLKQNEEWFVTAMIDLYALPADFPQPDPSPTPGLTQVDAIEGAFEADIRSEIGEVYPWRFIPFVLRHELEALLFADPEVTAEVIKPGDSRYARELQGVRDAFESPEDINNSLQTAPSKRLGGVYRKTRHAPTALGKIGVPAVRAACPRFDAWLQKLEALGGG